MRRNYTREAYLELISDIRKRIPGVALSSDFIAGFCSETEEEFQDTLDLIKTVRYDMVETIYSGFSIRILDERKDSRTQNNERRRARRRQAKQTSKNDRYVLESLARNNKGRDREVSSSAGGRRG